jgi:hypothetical protein
MNANATIKAGCLEHPHIGTPVKRVWHYELGWLRVLGPQLVSQKFEIRWYLHPLAQLLIYFIQVLCFCEEVEEREIFFELSRAKHRVHLQCKCQRHVLKHIHALILAVGSHVLVQQMLWGDASVVLEVVDELASSKCVHKVKLNASWELLPLKIIEFIEGGGLLPPWFTQLQALAHHGPIVARHNRELVQRLILVHLLVASGKDRSFFLL